MGPRHSLFNKFLFFTFILLLLIIPNQGNSQFPETDTIIEKEDIEEFVPKAVMDLALVGQIYLSHPDLSPGDSIDIYVKMQNEGTETIEGYTTFTIQSEDQLETLKSESVKLVPAAEKFAKVQWTALEGVIEIDATATIVGQSVSNELNIDNNILRTRFTVDSPTFTDLTITADDIFISDLVNQEDHTYPITGIVHNTGNFDTIATLQISETNYQRSTKIASLTLEIPAFSSQVFNYQFLPYESYHVLEFQVFDSLIDEESLDNNRAIKEFNQPDILSEGIDGEIDITDTNPDRTEIIPGDTQTLSLAIHSASLTGDFQVIVGGITTGVHITPDQWIVSLEPSINYNLGITISIDTTIAIDTILKVELLLYKIGDASDVIHRIFEVRVVENYSTVPFSSQPVSLENGITTQFFLPTINIDEVNPPIISSLNNYPLYPSVGENISVSADITDDTSVDNATLYYSFNAGVDWTTVIMQNDTATTWNANITTPGSQTSVLYYVNASDTFGNYVNSSQQSFVFDGTSPQLPSMTILTTVSSLSSVDIDINIADNVGVNTSTVLLYYSYDNSSYFSVQMSPLNGTTTDGYYRGTIPSTTDDLVYYYVNATDLSGLLNSSSIETYTIDEPPIIENISLSPTSPQVNSSTTVLVNITETEGIAYANISYSYMSNSGNLSMIYSNGLYSASIPATVNDTVVSYYVYLEDTFGHSITGSVNNYYSDGILPTISNLGISDTTPNFMQSVNITAKVEDSNAFRNVTLYYSFDSGSTWNPVNMTISGTSSNASNDVLLVYSTTQNTGYITRNGFSFDQMTASAFASTNVATLSQYRIIILSPNWADYNYLRTGLPILDQAMEETSISVSIRVAGNGGSQNDIDFLGTDYDRTTTYNAESFVDSQHPFITGAPWGGSTLATSYFNSWSSTDHGLLYNLPTSQAGYTEILQNIAGVSMFEYQYKDSYVMVDTLTSIDGGWGSGNTIVANNYINYLNYTYWNVLHPDTFVGTIPAAPTDTTVQYYVNATDVANNSRISPTLNYFSDASLPEFVNITQLNTISELDNAIINVTVIDNDYIDNTTVMLTYTFDNSTYFQTSMALLTGNNTVAIFQATIPATSQSVVYYFMSAYDRSGLFGTSSNSSYLVDLQPVLNDQYTTPVYPNANSSVTIIANVTDDVGIASVSLFHNMEGNWTETSMTLDTLYQAVIAKTNTTQTVSYIISITDTYGHIVNTTTYQYYSDGTAPTFDNIITDPVQPNADNDTLIQAQISDISGVQNATLHYSSDSGSSWTNVTLVFNSGFWEEYIPAFNISIEITYFISAFDNANVSTESNYYVFQTDTQSPTLSNLAQIPITSVLQAPMVNVTVSDNLAIDPNNVYLFYSYDNSSWFSVQMINITGNTTISTFQQTIPSTTQSLVYYYAVATDFSGRTNYTSILNYTTDQVPVINSIEVIPIIASAFTSTDILSNITDDISVVSATLFYNSNSTWYQTPMTNLSSNFTGTIPATGVDTTVSYYVSTIDSYGHVVNSTTLNYYADGILPSINEIIQSPTYPTGLQNVTVSVDISDNQGLLNATLFYSTNGTWIPLNITISTLSTINGRDPLTGEYYGTSRTADYNSGQLRRLYIYTYSSDSDTMTVILWGYRIDTGVWEQFYSSSILGTGYIPEFNWADPIYEQWRIQIYDSEYNDNFHYTYEYDSGENPPVIIPATNTSVVLQYYIEVFDVAENKVNSSIYNYLTDIDPPIIANITNPGIISELTSARINTTVSDFNAVNMTDVILYYSYDQTIWYSSQMMNVSGDVNFSNFTALIPATNNSVVYYYINATDLSGFISQSLTYNYTINTIPAVSSILTDPEFPNPNQLVTTNANITSDDVITSVQLNYWFNGTEGTSAMINSSGIFVATIPATINHTLVQYNLTMTDTFGHTVTSNTYTYTSDGISPEFLSITRSPLNPNTQQNVSINAYITDDSALDQVVLYYSTNEGASWTSVVMNGTQGLESNLPTTDVLLVSHGHVTSYLTRNGFTFDTISASAFASITEQTLENYRILILEPNWSNYANLRNGLVIVDQYLESNTMAVAIRVAGNGGSQNDIDFLGTDYDRTSTSSSETVIDSQHPFISGSEWGGSAITSTNFASWGSTDHGWFTSLPTSQSGYTEILQNANGISMFEYMYKDSPILVDTLTAIEGTWGSGNSAVADNFVNYLNYSYYQQVSTQGYVGVIPSVPADTTVDYYVTATDLAGNLQISNTSSYFVDGVTPTISTVTQLTTITEGATVTINATIGDNYGIDSSEISLFYSYDNSTYFQLAMTPLGSNTTLETYQGTIPGTSNAIVYYFVYAADISGLISVSSIFTYSVDLYPVLQSLTFSPLIPSAFQTIEFNASITDDVGVFNVTLHYNYNSSWYATLMFPYSGNFSATISPINWDGDLLYYLEIFDTFGNQVITSQQSQYIDGNVPQIFSILHNPEFPTNNSPVNVTLGVLDQSLIKNATLYYTVNGSSWNSITMNETAASTSSGRDPVSGTYYATTRLTDYDSGPLTRLLIYGDTSDLDTLYIILWGYSIATDTWVQFYSSSTLGTGYLPEFNWATPIYNQWRIQIYDTDNNDNFYYTYEYDSYDNWEASIPGFGQGTEIVYYIRVFDNAGNFATSSNSSYTVDSTVPRITSVTTLIAAATSDIIQITARIADYGALNSSLSYLYYSYDNSSWFTVPMSSINGTDKDGFYVGSIPATVTDETVSYYIEAMDLTGQRSVSAVYSYVTVDVSINLDYPNNLAVLNGTEVYNLTFTIHPNTSIVEISFDNQQTWNLINLDPSNVFIYSLDTNLFPEGELNTVLNVTLLEGISFIQYFTFFIDRSAPLILNYTQFSVVDGEGQSMSILVEESVIDANFTVSLFYSYDNSTWYETQLSFSSQTASNSTYIGILPSSTIETSVFYYFYVEDNLGLTNQSQTHLATIDYSPTLDSLDHIGDVIRADNGVNVIAYLTDDIGIDEVNLYFTNVTGTYALTVNAVNDYYLGTIPATISDTIITYWIEVRDTFGHVFNSTTRNYYSDALAPEIINLIASISNPNLNSPVTIFTNLQDANSLDSTTLFYSLDGTLWSNTSLSLSTSQTLIGRSPLGGTYENTTISEIYSSGPLQRLSISVSTTQIDSVDVVLRGLRIDNGQWEIFYNAVGLSTVAISPFNWVSPIYSSWQIEISDSSFVSQFSYDYEMDVEATHQGTIPASLQDGNVQYYIEVQDAANYTSTLNSSYYVDGIAPTIQGVTTLSPVSQSVSPRIWVNITDNFGIASPELHYSPDGSNWYVVSMTYYSGNLTASTFFAYIPIFSDGLISYFVNVQDYHDLISTSFTWYYEIDTVPIIQYLTNYPLTVGLGENVTVTTFVSDDYGISGVTLIYMIGEEITESPMTFKFGAYEGVIPSFNSSDDISYFIAVEDTLGQVTTSSIFFISVDNVVPNLEYISNPSESIPIPSEIVIEIEIRDNVEIDSNSVFLYYSADNTTWYSVAMQFAGGINTNSRFIQVIPLIPTNIIFYYVLAVDSVGLSNVTTVLNYTILTFPDADADGLADWAEINIYNSDPNNSDSDSDGLNDYDEIYTWGTDILNADTDGDRMADGWEVDYQFDPLTADGNGDRDGDGLSNSDEFVNGTDPSNPDTDSDGMPDGWEVNNGLSPLIDDSAVDTDADGLNNVNEYSVGTNPRNNDTDSDGMADGWEVDNLLLPLIDDSRNDTDSDGLTNLGEFQSQTNPNDPDTDADGMSDGWEVDNGTDPLVDDSNEDPDDDGLSNLLEYEENTNPQSPDTDSDGMPDQWEVEYGLNPRSNDSRFDPDEDGLTNYEEYLAGTDPLAEDTDLDGMPDGWEVLNQLLPNFDDSIEDPDEDLLVNLDEFLNDTDPNNPDTDDDGMPDGWEVQYGLNPNDPSDASEDPDEDGITNLEEYEQDKNPLVCDSPEFNAAGVLLGTVIVTAPLAYVGVRRAGGLNNVINRIRPRRND